MATFEVKAESLPERCEICHQADLFNRETGYCARCSPLATQAAAPPEWQPQPFTPAPPFAPQPPAVPHPFAPPPPPPQPFPYPPPVPQPFSYPPPMQYGAPQPYPYQPPVSPLAPTLPRVIHENPTLQIPYQPPPRLHFRYIGPTTVSEWTRFRDAALGGLIGALPMAALGLYFLLNSEILIYLALIAEVVAAAGFAGFRVGDRLRGASQRTEAKSFREHGVRSAILATFPLFMVPFLYFWLSEVRHNPSEFAGLFILIALLLIPLIFCLVGVNALGGYLAARTVEFLERRNLVATTTSD